MRTVNHQRLRDTAARLLYYNPDISKATVAAAIGCGRRTIDRHYANLQILRDECCISAVKEWRKVGYWNDREHRGTLGTLKEYHQRACKLGFNFLLLADSALYEKPGILKSFTDHHLSQSPVLDEILLHIGELQVDRFLTGAYSTQWLLMLFISTVRISLETKGWNRRLCRSTGSGWTTFLSVAAPSGFDRSLIREEMLHEYTLLNGRVI